MFFRLKTLRRGTNQRTNWTRNLISILNLGLRKVGANARSSLLLVVTLVFGVSIFMTVQSAQGATTKSHSEEEEREIVKRVKLRTYLGGRDEEDIKVLPHLVIGKKENFENQKPVMESD